MAEEKYLSLIHKKLSSGLNSTEQTELDQWINADKVNLQTLEDYKAVWKLTELVEGNFEVDTDEGFDKLQKRFKAEETISQTTAPTVANVPNVVPMRRRLLQVAASVALLIGAGFLFNLYNTNNVSTNWITVTTADDEKKLVTLEDGTIVSINQNSTFTYPESFDTKSRNVTLKGEAFFEVAKDESKSFFIDTEKTTVTVLGTAFNVRAYEAEQKTEVMVKTGDVKFAPKNNNEAVQLTAFKKGIYDHTNRKLRATILDHLNAIAWHSGDVKFKSVPLKEVLRCLRLQLNCVIEVENKRLLGCKYTGNFSKLKAEQIVDAISTSFNALKPTYNTSIKEFFISGGSCQNN